jgi:hypothetical protein
VKKGKDAKRNWNFRDKGWYQKRKKKEDEEEIS